MDFVDNSVVNVMTVDEGGSNGAIVIVISVVLLIVLLIPIIAGIYCCKHRKCTDVQNCIGKNSSCQSQFVEISLLFEVKN